MKSVLVSSMHAALPKADEEGNVSPLEYVRASIVRDIFRDRRALGLTQEKLVKLSCVRQETICRLETGLHSPRVGTVEKIERALKRAGRKWSAPSRSRL